MLVDEGFILLATLKTPSLYVQASVHITNVHGHNNNWNYVHNMYMYIS